MALFDIKIPNRIAKALRLPDAPVKRQQKRVLKRLLKKARFTEFGQKYHFNNILIQNRKCLQMALNNQRLSKHRNSRSS